MPRTAPRGGPQTRVRIAEAAAPLFQARGFDAVTVAEVARAAGVSSVTVFKHFPRKEDLFFDRTADAEELLRAIVRDRAPGHGLAENLERILRDLAADRAPLSGLADGSVDFFRTVAGSPALQARALGIAAELSAGLAAELSAATAEGELDGVDDPALAASLVVAGCAALLVGTAQRLLAGDGVDAIARDHRARVERLVDALRAGVLA